MHVVYFSGFMSWYYSGYIPSPVLDASIRIICALDLSVTNLYVYAPWTRAVQRPATEISMLTYFRFYDNEKHTSKHAIMIPQAGAIFVIRGTMPAYSADMPSLRRISAVSARLDVVVVVADISIACLRVLRTSKGDVNSAAVVPLRAPLAKATPAPS